MPLIYGEKAYADGVTGLMDVTYRTVRGFRPLKLDLFYTANDQRAKPAVMYIHGGAWAGSTPRATVFSNWAPWIPYWRDWPRVAT